MSDQNKSFTICPLDNRYQEKVANVLGEYFSDYALYKYRTYVEATWVVFLIENIELPEDITFPENYDNLIMGIYNKFNTAAYNRIREIESTTNHDVKAVEYYVGEEFKKCGLDSLVPYIHIGCTSEDINNTAYALMIKNAIENCFKDEMTELVTKVSSLAGEYKDTTMLAHTHGQPATPTTVGKEFAVYASRLATSIKYFNSIDICAKFNGATGNYSAISVAFPNENWPCLCRDFVENYLQLSFNPMTTQIENHDFICRLLNELSCFNNIAKDLDMDMWLYISKGYFKSVVIKGEIGSSTMPHKVNPIQFENSEANFTLSSGICNTLAQKLPCSRMQRDLSDSSTMRNVGLPFGYSLQAINELIKGLNRVTINLDAINADLSDHPEVLAEPIQTMLRKYSIPNAYEKLKEITRGKHVAKEDMLAYVDSIKEYLSLEDYDTLKNLTQFNYTGEAAEITEDLLYEIE